MKKIFFLFLFFASFSVSAQTIEQAFSQCYSALAERLADFPDGICSIHNSSYVAYYYDAHAQSIGNYRLLYFYSSGCPADTTLDQVTGTCQTPVDCSDGASASVWAPPEERDGELEICIGDGCSRKVDYNGCEYIIYPSTDIAGCGVSAAEGYGCNYNAVKTGESAGTTSGSTPALDEDLSMPKPLDDCLKAKGVEVCAPSLVASDTDNCSSVNGQDLCASTDTGCGTINGSKVCSSDEKNCGRSTDGRYVCIAPPSSATSLSITDNNGRSIKLDGKSAVKTNESKSIQTNPDGSTTSTVTKTNNVINDEDVVTTTINNLDGTSTTTTTGEGSPDAEQNEQGQEQIDLLKQIKKNQIDGHDILREIAGLPEDYDTTQFGLRANTESQNAVDAALENFNSWNNPFDSLSLTAITDWLPTLPSSSCSGAISTTIFGRSFVLDPCTKLQPLRDILAWVFSILAALSVIKTVFSISSRES